MEVCKSCSASGIELEITTIRKSSLYFLLTLLFFSEDRKSVLCPGLSVSIGHSDSISRQKLNMCDFVAKAGIASEHWGPCIERH